VTTEVTTGDLTFWLQQETCFGSQQESLRWNYPMERKFSRFWGVRQLCSSWFLLVYWKRCSFTQSLSWISSSFLQNIINVYVFSP